MCLEDEVTANMISPSDNTIPWSTIDPASIPVCGDELGLLPLPSCCPGCGVVLVQNQLALNAYVCRCGHHFPLHAEAWVALLSDRHDWFERWDELAPHDVPEWVHPKPYRQVLEEGMSRGLNESLRCGTCRIGGRRFVLAVFDFRFVAGTLGTVAGERLARGMERAIADRSAFLLIAASGGARMQEGTQALLQMAKLNATLATLHEAGIPFFSVLTNPTYGGTAASVALLADVNIAEPGAAIGFSGPRVIEQSTHERLPADFQTAEFQLQHGQVDMIISRTELRRKLARLYDLLQ
jgi:acetyl-CoA carboxylase carboxyl transferase subunit beta